MQLSLNNPFNSYELTEEEKRVGCHLTHIQKAVIQNHISSIAQQKLALKADPDNPMAYWQEEAFLRGQLDVLNHLLDTSAVVEAFFAQN